VVAEEVEEQRRLEAGVARAPADLAKPDQAADLADPPELAARAAVLELACPAIFRPSWSIVAKIAMVRQFLAGRLDRL
jgi:hypothetical protein